MREHLREFAKFLFRIALHHFEVARLAAPGLRGIDGVAQGNRRHLRKIRKNLPCRMAVSERADELRQLLLVIDGLCRRRPGLVVEVTHVLVSGRIYEILAGPYRPPALLASFGG